jgi:hypothetical protein
MPRSIWIPFVFGVALLLLSAVHTGGAEEFNQTTKAAPASQTFALTDTKDLLVAPGVKVEAVEYRGRKAVRLTKEAWMSRRLRSSKGRGFAMERLR